MNGVALTAVVGFGGATAVTATAAEQISPPAASAGGVVLTPDGTTNAEY